jgi:hypothetical protein
VARRRAADPAPHTVQGIGAACNYLEQAGKTSAVDWDHPAVEKDARFRTTLPLNRYEAQFNFSPLELYHCAPARSAMINQRLF